MNVPTGRIGVLVVNFGEPDEPTLDKVESYLERIFAQNMDLEDRSAQTGLERARQLATARAPGLMEVYVRIGGSPLNEQADAQAAALRGTLGQRNWDVQVYSAFQFTSPSIAGKVAEARRDGVETLVGLPIYPICGKSTTVEALKRIRVALSDLEWRPPFVGVSGWHHHPAYVRFRTDHIRTFLKERRLDVTDADTVLYFSVHGTPIKYLNEGNRYDRYVEEHCRAIARGLGADRYAVGFQNHSNRGIPWTQPDNEDRIRATRETHLVVVPISFMHEQSETLAELDHDLNRFAEGIGKQFHRVPVPHDDPRFAHFLGDLTAAAITADGSPPAPLTACTCSGVGGVWCTNGGRELPPSPYGSVDR